MIKFKYIILSILAMIENYFSKNKVVYIVENANWSIKHDGKMITSNLKQVHSRIAITFRGIRHSVVHFGSLNLFFTNKGFRNVHKSNKVIVTVFHIVNGDKRANYIAQADNFVDYWHTSCQKTKNKLISFGASPQKIIVIPIGIELKAFSVLTLEEKCKKRKELGVPDNAIVIGSFQKDGNGWGEGLEPKLIKGPDIFCDVVEKLSKKYDIFVLLTGPARGYVKKRLYSAGIQYKHEYVENSNEVANYFQLCDLYMVTSREEGGPKALMEAMASGVPLISTKVGMAPDIIIDGENGFLVDVEDIDALYKRACEVIDNKELQDKFIKNGLEIVKSYDYKILSSEYEEKLYKKLI